MEKFVVDIRYIIEAEDDDENLTDRIADLTYDLPDWAEYDSVMLVHPLKK